MDSDPITENSPSVQSHLQIIQGVINRMASNSAASKAWCITVVSAILVLVADKGKPEFAYLAFIPLLLFGALDGYYLAFEKAYRASYNAFVEKLHTGTLETSDIYAVRPKGNLSKHQFDAIRSFSVWGFYISLGIMILLARFTVINL